MSNQSTQRLRTFAEINLEAVKHNFQQIQSLNLSQKVMAVVKANAYGHGMVEVAQILAEAGCDYLAVATTLEGRQLRESGVSLPILVFGNPDLLCVHDYFDFNLDASISDIETAQFLHDYAGIQHKKIKIHIKVDTGMGRYGFDDTKSSEILTQIALFKNLEIQSLWSHFGSADAESPVFTRLQINRFLQVKNLAQKLKLDIPDFHMANSAGILRFPDSHLTMIRPGILLYGYAPFKTSLNLLPVMTLKSHVSLIKKVEKGTPISYFGTWIADVDSHIALVPIGYADGVLRSLSNKMSVVINGKLYPQVGNVTMDHIMVNIGSTTDVKNLDEVCLFGHTHINAHHWAGWAKTITWEILCSVTNRVPRTFIK